MPHAATTPCPTGSEARQSTPREGNLERAAIPGKMRTMTAHRIETYPAVPPKTLTARCACGDWARDYVSVEEWSHVLDGAREHVVSRCGSYDQVDDGQTGMITVTGQEP